MASLREPKSPRREWRLCASQNLRDDNTDGYPCIVLTYPVNSPSIRYRWARSFARPATPVVISAATAVGAVFVAFALDPDVIVRMTCVGVAVGMLIDIVAVRLILMPVVTTKLGRGVSGRTFLRGHANQRSDLIPDAHH